MSEQFQSFENVPIALSVCLCCRQLNETENQQDTANIYRNMSWEVHIKSLGIHLTKVDWKRGVKSQMGEGAEKERWETIPTI